MLQDCKEVRSYLFKMSTAKEVACDVITRESASLREVSLDIWNNPELCFEEHHAHKVITDFLENKGFQVERHYKLDTAFRAVMSSPSFDEQSPIIGVMCEYDALPGIGHACGHNLITTVGLAVGLGVKAAMEKGIIKGKLVVLGCPAEESGGGKIELINAGAYEGMDVAMMAHPSLSNFARPSYLSISRFSVKYHGKESHAGVYPWNGLNALDAAVLCYQNVSCLRQQMKPTWRVHGVISNGGDKPNVIPHETGLDFYARAPTESELKILEDKLKNCFEAAALATGCKVTIDTEPNPYAALISNDTLASLYETNAISLGVEFDGPKPAGGSTDMGNVSRVLPSIHPRFKLQGTSNPHTRGFRDIAGSESSHDATMLYAKALAMAAIDVYSNPDLVAKMKEEFKLQLEADQ